MGRGDRLLESLETTGRERLPGIKTTFLLTTRTMDWFAQRGYMAVGPAHEWCACRLPTLCV
jgi:N-acetylglutamate synthase-like GNAT family acetyltransferase